MGQGRFLDAVDDACDRLTDENSDPEFLVNVSSLTQELFDRWLFERRYDGLIEYIHYQYECGGGNQHIDALSEALLQDRDGARLSRLWKGVIAGRRQQFWIEQKYALKSGVEWNIQNAAQLKASTLDAMARYLSYMLALGNSPEVARILEGRQLLEEGRKRKLPTPDPRAMDDALFWQLIDMARNDAAGVADFLERLTAALSGFKASAIKAFQKILDAKLAQLWSWDLWALAYIVRKGCSDDSFDYFRAWVVAHGRQAFDAALAGPDALAEAVDFDWDLQCEGLTHVAANAHLERQDREMSAGKLPRIVLKGQPWRED